MIFGEESFLPENRSPDRPILVGTGSPKSRYTRTIYSDRLLPVMKIFILGAGLLGIQTARELSEENKDVVMIERDPDVARMVANELDCSVLEGDGEDAEFLEEAGLAEADWFIALTGSDEANIVACGIVSENFKRPRTIARVRSGAFAAIKKRNRRFLGVDHILNPDSVTAETIGRFAREGRPGSVVMLKEPGIQLRKFPAHRDSRFPGRQLQDIRLAVGNEFLVPAVVRKSVMTAPNGSFLFESDDIVYVLGSPSGLERSFGSATSSRESMKSVLIIGATSLADHVMTEFGVSTFASENRRSMNLNITLIDEDRGKAKHFAVKYPGIEVICRDFTDELLLEHEQVGKFDLVLCLTDSQSFNVVIGQLAKFEGARRVLSAVLNDAYMKLEGRIDLDAMINQKTTVAGAILDLVRRANIKRLHSFAEGELELVELAVGSGSGVAGVALKNLGLPKQILIAFIIHDGHTIIPNGDMIIEFGDTVGVVLPKNQIERIESLFGA
jgi:trk system potassium uptake protein TrkA